MVLGGECARASCTATFICLLCAVCCMLSAVCDACCIASVYRTWGSIQSFCNTGKVVGISASSADSKTRLRMICPLNTYSHHCLMVAIVFPFCAVDIASSNNYRQEVRRQEKEEAIGTSKYLIHTHKFIHSPLQRLLYAIVGGRYSV